MKEKVLIFGTGGYLRKHEEALKEDYEIAAYVDNYTYVECNYDGKEIIKPDRMKEYDGRFDSLIVMLEKVSLNMAVVRQLLLDKHIEADKVIIGLTKYDFHNEFNISVLQDGRWDIQFSDASVIVSSEMEFWDLYSLYYEETYFHKLNNSKKDVVIDIGMNIGDSAIYYLNKPETEKVYGFEPFLQTYLQAEENLKRNDFERDRYEIFQYGLSDHDEKTEVSYHPEISIMLSTNNQFNRLEFRDYERTHDCVLENIKADIEVRKASGVIGQIMKRHSDNNIVLKIDCEGEEYAILDDLDKEGLLNKVNFITLEWHYGGREKIESYFNRNGFSYCGRKIHKDLGQLYAWK